MWCAGAGHHVRLIFIIIKCIWLLCKCLSRLTCWLVSLLLRYTFETQFQWQFYRSVPSRVFFIINSAKQNVAQTTYSPEDSDSNLEISKRVCATQQFPLLIMTNQLTSISKTSENLQHSRWPFHLISFHFFTFSEKKHHHKHNDDVA